MINKSKLIECVPNFSEGRRKKLLRQLFNLLEKNKQRKIA